MKRIFVMLILSFLLIAPATASVVELQNRTVNLSSNFNIYIKINATEPVRAFGADFEYDPEMLKVNYIKFGDLAYKVPAGKYLEFQNFNFSIQNRIINSCQYLTAPYNRTGKITYLTLNVKGLQKGSSYIRLNDVRLIRSRDQSFFEMYETCRFRDSFFGRDGNITNSTFLDRNDTPIYKIRIT